MTRSRSAIRWILATLGLVAAFASVGILPGAQAADSDTGYQPPAGAAFFLLSDTSFASDEPARVRVEVERDSLWQLLESEGLDVALYRVEQPLEFLRKQRNLHRIELKAAVRPEGLANTIAYLWDQWWLRARQSWQNLFSAPLRTSVTRESPALKTGERIAAPTSYHYPSPYRALPGLTEVMRMRYPIGYAQPIAPPADLNLQGSSSGFIAPREGNVHVPLGKQAPGLYVVEAAAGRHRATALLFVSDTMALSKTSSHQFLIWTAQRDNGRPAQAQIIWTDLNGVLGSGRTDGDGVLVVDHAVPETSYAFGIDAAGGVFVTENFYYDSEIHQTKLYAYTDRPLYRPGDEVQVHLHGRDYQSATRSKALPAQSIAMTVIDATGNPVDRQTLAYHPQDGAAARFTLPANAPSGGYEIRLQRGDDEYGAAFRVATYVKPHFEISIEPEQASYRTGQPLHGRIRLHYFDGKPVANAALTLSARAQQLTMVDGDLRYGGLFALQIDDQQALRTDAEGEVRFALPAATEPSRVVLSVLASDGAALRVRASHELLIERAASAWRLTPDRQFASAGQTMRWSMAAIDAAPGVIRPERWIAIHQQSQSRSEGAIDARADYWDLRLERAGSYRVEIRDAAGSLLGAAPFQVAVSESTPARDAVFVKPIRGAIEIVLDKPRYRVGDTARALITFPEAVDDALLTLERDKVDAYARLAAPGRLARLRRLSPQQWEATLTVPADFAPNMTLSVAYLKGGEAVFQNAGIVVEQPSLQVQISADKPTYAPGDIATLTLSTTDPQGRPAPAVLSVGVVDEMVYALQAELAPGVHAFFDHLRRNNVRTHTSQSFISFDEAIDAGQPASIGRQRNDRAVKMLDRPRRDDRDTAWFAPAVRTDAQGRALVQFVVPDALTRWRITAKAYGRDGADGLMGERRAWVRSDKAWFARFTAPNWARIGDRPQATLAVFNQRADTAALTVRAELDGQRFEQRIDARAGANFVALDLPALQQPSALSIELWQSDRVVDRLSTPIDVLPAAWPTEHQQLLTVASGESSTALPALTQAQASQLSVRVVPSGLGAWRSIADSLIDYPYGGVEQTASRIVPLALAVRSAQGDTAAPLRQRLAQARLRLAAMAGPDAVFGWWGPSTAGSAFLSAHAYHADWLAGATLGLDLPAAHWQQLQTIYANQREPESLARRSWTVWLMQAIGLPTATMTDALLNDWQRRYDSEASAVPASAISKRDGTAVTAAPNAVQSRLTSTALYAPLAPSREADDVALLIVAQLAAANKRTWPQRMTVPLSDALARLTTSTNVLAQAALAAGGHRPLDDDALHDALRRASAATATIDRSLALTLLARLPSANLLPASAADEASLQPAAPWQLRKSLSGQPVWRHESPDTPIASRIDWQRPVASDTTIALHWRDYREPSGSRLSAEVARKLYRLTPEGQSFRAQAVMPGEPLSAQHLYLDELRVRSAAPLSFALLEAALPPGSAIEPTTWGITIRGADGKPQPLSRATAEGADAAVDDGLRGTYRVPLDRLDSGTERIVQHLVRFGQKGVFELPPARLWRMYAPHDEVRELPGNALKWRIS